jgi:ATP-binding cassette subfamily F protein 3
VDIHIERGDRIALIGPNGAGKSTLMRMLSGVEGPDSGTRTEGHQVVMQYFAQDEATRLDPTLTVYQTLAGNAPMNMVPAIRNILGGFLFSGDDIEKPVRVLSGGERTRLAVARMLLRPSNTLLLDEPTNHLDLDSKDVLLEALEDFGGTLIFVSHDRYFVDKLATKVMEIGGGGVLVYPGNYEEFLWSRSQQAAARTAPAKPAPAKPVTVTASSAALKRASGPKASWPDPARLRGAHARLPASRRAAGRSAPAVRRPPVPLSHGAARPSRPPAVRVRSFLQEWLSLSWRNAKRVRLGH